MQEELDQQGCTTCELATYIRRLENVAKAAKKAVYDTAHKPECVGKRGIFCKCWQKEVFEALVELGDY
jgi:hypothetical protein